MTIALCAIMLNETAYVDRWAATSFKRGLVTFDEVLVVDGGSVDDTVKRLRSHGITVIERPFDRHFAAQRNFALDHCTADWVFELDADEVPSVPLLSGLSALVRDAEAAQFDCIGIPRLNFIDGSLVAGPGHQGLDYQYRLHRRACRWRGAVHEEVTGYRARHELAIVDGHFISHDKGSARHAERNAMYETITP